MIDIQRFNLSEFFGCVKATDTKEMKSNQLRSFRTQLQELSFAKWSDGQLRYVGAYKDGMDFESLSEDHLRYEMKGTMNMFQKNGRTKTVILKNFQSENKIVKQTFDYMLLVDTTNYKIGISSWNQLKDKIVFNDSSPCAKFQLDAEDYKIIAENIEPKKKSITAEWIIKSFDAIL